MLTLKITDMTCNHCFGLINRAIKEMDAHAVVTADFTSRIINVQSSQSQEEIIDALEEIGYPAKPESTCCSADRSCKSQNNAN
tara:strand:- start:27528 stop:27776 length:249 start_codon:yes stop_codon:yes gene_type:complete